MTPNRGIVVRKEAWEALRAERDQLREKLKLTDAVADDLASTAGRYRAALEDVGRYLAVIPWNPSVGEALASIERALRTTP